MVNESTPELNTGDALENLQASGEHTVSGGNAANGHTTPINGGNVVQPSDPVIP